MLFNSVAEISGYANDIKTGPEAPAKVAVRVNNGKCSGMRNTILLSVSNKVKPDSQTGRKASQLRLAAGRADK